MMIARELTTSEREWLEVREYLRKHRHELDQAAAAEFPEIPKVADTPLLTTPNWLPTEPIAIDDIELKLEPDRPFHPVTDGIVSPALPLRADGTCYRSYSEAMAELAAPAVFENRTTYRLLDADLFGTRGRMTFGRGRYFDGVDTGEAAAHEFAAKQLGCSIEGGIREAIGNPCDPTQRPMNMAISTLTIRRDEATGESTVFLHWRDPVKVGHAGGLYQVVPVGIFQPSGEAAWNERNDFSLWRNTIREFAEELLGTSEDHGSERSSVDYDNWPFAVTMTRNLRDDAVHCHCVGLGVDPLTYATDLLVKVSAGARVFDDMFGTLVNSNAEGTVSAIILSNQCTSAELLRGRRFQAAGEAVITLSI